MLVGNGYVKNDFYTFCIYEKKQVIHNEGFYEITEEEYKKLNILFPRGERIEVIQEKLVINETEKTFTLPKIDKSEVVLDASILVEAGNFKIHEMGKLWETTIVFRSGFLQSTDKKRVYFYPMETEKTFCIPKKVTKHIPKVFGKKQKIDISIYSNEIVLSDFSGNFITIAQPDEISFPDFIPVLKRSENIEYVDVPIEMLESAKKTLKIKNANVVKKDNSWFVCLEHEIYKDAVVLNPKFIVEMSKIMKKPQYGNHERIHFFKENEKLIVFPEMG